MKPQVVLDPDSVLSRLATDQIDDLCDYSKCCDLKGELSHVDDRSHHVVVVLSAKEAVSLQTVASAAADLRSHTQITIVLWDAGRRVFQVIGTPKPLASLRTLLLEHSPSAIETEQPHNAVGGSSLFRRVISQLQAIGRAPSNIVIYGESGTGKELAARIVHNASPRATKPLVCINCAAIPDSLLESQMFGHERGAFTGADRQRDGAFGEAHSGTLVLDEVSDLSAAAQAKLLRAIETKLVSRLGSFRETPVDIRIVALTNKPLEALVERGVFRQDLYYRLNVIGVEMPPLRERIEDLPDLVTHFTTGFSRTFARDIDGTTEEVLEIFRRYSWPGNVRELRNVIEGCFIACGGAVISVEDLPRSFTRRIAELNSGRADERGRVLSALEACRWNKSKAAAKLNWSRVTLYRKITKYRLGRPTALPTD